MFADSVYSGCTLNSRQSSMEEVRSLLAVVSSHGHASEHEMLLGVEMRYQILRRQITRRLSESQIIQMK